MERKIMKDLLEWKNKGSDRKPLVLNGARQVGKTYVLREFGDRHYKNVVYVNFEKDFKAQKIFSESLSPENVIKLLELHSNSHIIPDRTLIIFDEVQECDRALTSLKYFCEDANEFHIVAAGSLLGVALNKGKRSFPVGKVDFLTLYPMDFEEYLMANGQGSLIEQIKQCIEKDEPMPEFMHATALEKYKVYLYSGGMPGVVSMEINGRTRPELRKEHENILNSYISDMAKYATGTQAIKIRSAFDTIDAQLAKENHKFQYKMIQKGASASLFGESIDWLTGSRIVLKCRRIEHGIIPVSTQVDLSAFKLYMADTGLLLAKANVTEKEFFLEFDEFAQFRGGVTENYVAQSLAANGYELYYWESKGISEIDFVIHKDSKIIPVEVKSGQNNRSKSLGVYTEKYKPEYAIRISEKNFGFANGIKSVPLYAVFMI